MTWTSTFESARPSVAMKKALEAIILAGLGDVRIISVEGKWVKLEHPYGERVFRVTVEEGSK